MLACQQNGHICHEKYQQTIGGYIVDLAAQNCDNPCIQLVATQMDSEDGQEKDLRADIWRRVEEHLKYYSENNKQIILADGILNTSAKGSLH